MRTIRGGIIVGKSRIADILITRDRVTREQAMDKINYCCQRLEEESIPYGDHDMAEEIIRDELGMESDILMDLL